MFFSFLRSYSLLRADLFALIFLMFSARFSAVTSFPVSFSTSAFSSRISSAHFFTSLSLFICGRSITCIGTSVPRISYAFFLPSQVVSPMYTSAQTIERTCSVETRTQHRLDQRAGVGRQVLLAARNPELGAGTETRLQFRLQRKSLRPERMRRRCRIPFRLLL